MRAILRDPGDRVDAAGQKLPERFGRARAAGEAAADADDGDRLVARGFECVDFRAQLANLPQRVAHQRGLIVPLAHDAALPFNDSSSYASRRASSASSSASMSSSAP